MIKTLKTSKRISLGLVLTVIASPGYCALGSGLCLNSKYIGADVGMQSTSINQVGLKKSLPKANLFVGVKFNDYLGVEVGYENNINGTKSVILDHTRSYYGHSNTSVNTIFVYPNRFEAKIQDKYKISGFHFGVTGEYPIISDNSLSLIGSLGVKHAKININSKVVEHSVLGDLNGINSNLKSTKNIFKASVGLKYMLKENIGIRLNGTWENTAKLKPQGVFSPLSNGVQYPLNAKLKNSMSYTLGVVFKF